MITIAHHWREWSDPRLIVCVLNNQDLNQVTWEQRVLAGEPKFKASQDVPEFSYAKYAELLGLKGIAVDSPKMVGQAWEEALSADRPVLIDAKTDPDVAPLPPHISFEQAKSYLSSIVKGDPDAYGTMKQSMQDMIEAWLPHPVK